MFMYVCSSLFNDVFQVTKTMQCWMKEWYVNDELERIWKEVFMA
jgi:hypothetical protein